MSVQPAADTDVMLVSILGAWAGSTIWVALDASRRVWSQPASPDGLRLPRLRHAWTWALATLVAWPIVFPAYLYQRAQAPLRPRS